MKIGIFQSHIIWENKELNIDKFNDILNSSDDDIELMLLPEMSFTGFSMNTKVTAESNEYTLKRISELSVKHSVNIGFGWVKYLDGKLYNCYSLVDNRGAVIAEYAKIHPFFCEQEIITGGTKTSLFSIKDTNFSISICYDLRFPELYRAAARTSSVMIVPANWPASRREHWLTLLRARAIENQIYVLGINCVGEIGDAYYSGDSCIVTPDGEIQMQTSDQEKLLVYNLTNDVENYREKFPVLKDSRWDLYRTFYNGIS